MKKTTAAILGVFAAALAAFVVSGSRVEAQQYSPFGNQLVEGARLHREFSITTSGQSTPLPLQSASYCVITVRTAPSAGTVTVFGASDNVPTFGSTPLTSFGVNGVITNPVASTMYPGSTVSPNGGPVAMSSIKIAASVTGTIVGSIDCSPMNAATGAVSIPNPLPVAGSCLPGTSSTTPVGNCWANVTHTKPPTAIGGEPPISQGAESNVNLGSGSTTSCTYYTGAGSGAIHRVVSFMNVTGAAVNATVSVYDTGPIGTTCSAATLRWTFNAAVYLQQPLNISLTTGMALVISTTLPDATDILVGVNSY